MDSLIFWYYFDKFGLFIITKLDWYFEFTEWAQSCQNKVLKICFQSSERHNDTRFRWILKTRLKPITPNFLFLSVRRNRLANLTCWTLSLVSFEHQRIDYRKQFLSNSACFSTAFRSFPVISVFGRGQVSFTEAGNIGSLFPDCGNPFPMNLAKISDKNAFWSSCCSRELWMDIFEDFHWLFSLFSFWGEGRLRLK